MIYAAPNASIVATLANAPTGLVGTMGVRILKSDGSVAVARTTAGIIEAPASSGTYIAALKAPAVLGTYVVFWDNGTVSPSTTAEEELVVTTSAPTTPPPTGSELCTLADVRLMMGKSEADKAQDPLIVGLIPGASAAVAEFCERQFAPLEAGVTKTFEWPWENEFLSLAPYDLRGAPTEVIVDTDHPPATGLVLSTEEFRVWPQPPRDGTYLALRLRPFGALMGRVMWRTRQVQVKGDWGFPSIPADVKEAAALTVAYRLRANPAALRRGDDGQIIPNPPQRAIPLEAQQLLGRYKRVAF